MVFLSAVTFALDLLFNMITQQDHRSSFSTLSRWLGILFLRDITRSVCTVDLCYLSSSSFRHVGYCVLVHCFLSCLGIFGHTECSVLRDSYSHSRWNIFCICYYHAYLFLRDCSSEIPFEGYCRLVLPFSASSCSCLQISGVLSFFSIFS